MALCTMKNANSPMTHLAAALLGAAMATMLLSHEPLGLSGTGTATGPGTGRGTGTGNGTGAGTGPPVPVPVPVPVVVRVSRE